LHLLDIAPVDGSDPVENFRIIENEVRQYSEGIADKDRWLVFTKLDLMTSEDAEARIAEIRGAIAHTGPVFQISAVSGEGTEGLSQAIQQYLVELREKEDAEEAAKAEEQRIRDETHAYSLRQRELRRERRRAAAEQDDDDDDFDVEVHYEP
jgi:GTP-binding protein